MPLTSASTYTYNTSAVNVDMYIIDTGIRASHVEFGGRVSSTGFTAINDGNGTNDCNGHGTHVAATTGGALYGVAKSVTLHAVRVLNCSGSGSTSGVIAGVNWVTANRTLPAVANMSLGGGVSTALDDAVRNSIASRVTYALFAPGSSITSAWYTNDAATNTISGTSMASPHVAGAAALYLADHPSASPAAVHAAIVNNASVNKLTGVGAGSPNRLCLDLRGRAVRIRSTAFTHLLESWHLYRRLDGDGHRDPDRYELAVGDGYEWWRRSVHELQQVHRFAVRSGRFRLSAEWDLLLQRRVGHATRLAERSRQRGLRSLPPEVERALVVDRGAFRKRDPKSRSRIPEQLGTIAG